MNMSMRSYKILTILLPPLIIGGFEYIRHDFLGYSDLIVEKGL
ncbi:hypothetical protein SAMN05421868_10383 [Paenibacillus naphthalenovorans]|nr:hypothetical protein SAMN05421868_10383 [Paenibacillus naphthalenovorans]